RGQINGTRPSRTQPTGAASHLAGPRSRWHSRERAPYRNRLANDRASIQPKDRSCPVSSHSAQLAGTHSSTDTPPKPSIRSAATIRAETRKVQVHSQRPVCKSFQPVSRERAAYSRGENRNSAGAREPVEPATKSAGSRHRAQISRDRARQSQVPKNS